MCLWKDWDDPNPLVQTKHLRSTHERMNRLYAPESTGFGGCCVFCAGWRSFSGSGSSGISIRSSSPESRSGSASLTTSCETSNDSFFSLSSSAPDGMSLSRTTTHGRIVILEDCDSRDFRLGGRPRANCRAKANWLATQRSLTWLKYSSSLLQLTQICWGSSGSSSI